MDKTGTIVVPDEVIFMFQLTKTETEILMFQIGTSSWGGFRKLPYAGCSGKTVNLNRNYYWQETIKLFRSLK